MPLPAHALEAPDRHTAIVDALGTEICGTLPTGTVLVVDDLCARFAASRTAIREALRVLGAKGLVAAKRGTGTTTLEASEWNLLDADVVRWRLRSPDRFHQLKEMLELRSAFEPEASALAAAHATPDQITALLSCAAKLWGLGHRDDPDAFIEADVEFHRLLLTASGNRIFAQLAPMIASILRGRLEEGLTPEHPDGRALDQHLALAGAIGGRDPEEARRLTRELVEATYEESRTLWEPAAPSA